jgi:hypothetical protein
MEIRQNRRTLGRETGVRDHQASERSNELRRRVIGCGFAIAMVAAPVLALLYGVTAGLAVLATALATTTYLLLDATRLRPDLRSRLFVLAGVNAALAALCIAALVWRLR